MGDVLALDNAAETERDAPGSIDATAEDGRLEALPAEARLSWAVATFPGRVVLSSSFGVQSAVLLHMASQMEPRIPVVLVDTGYLFAETYRFIDELTERLELDLRVYRPALSAAWIEARHGRLWEEGLDGLERYNRMHKIEPMQRALHELDAHAWISGIRRDQSASRRQRRCVELQNGRVKIHPIIDWTDRDIHRYLEAHDLPYHPLWHEGYTSVGDVHTTRRLADVVSNEETRFFGLKRECGLHEDA